MRAKWLKKAGAKIIFNHVSSENIPKEIIDKIDILFTNIDSKNTNQIEKIAKEKSASFINKGVKTVIINMLHKGYLLADYKEEKIVNNKESSIEKYSNCGDAFISALAAYMLYGYSTNQAAEIAAYAANYSNSREEITPSFIDKYTLETSINMPKNNLINQ
ncbi:PfkB family carbohydrate kinase [Gardnerella vaginalis]|uniref:PfkB family carbohydrate kinase n=1 Tax=Gardnerella vaginalis TaxID=2702 RepID=UPI0039EE8F8C